MQNRTFHDQKLAAVRQLLADRPELFVRQGRVVTTWRAAAGRRHGPYYALHYDDAHRQRSLYLGRSPILADEVRRLLETRRRPYRQRVAIQRARAAVKTSLRQHKRGESRVKRQEMRDESEERGARGGMLSSA